MNTHELESLDYKPNDKSTIVTLDEILFHLTWMIADMKRRFDDDNIGGGYSRQLLCAMRLRDKLTTAKNNNPEGIILR
jgi:hypothetical protein